MPVPSISNMQLWRKSESCNHCGYRTFSCLGKRNSSKRKQAPHLGRLLQQIRMLGVFLKPLDGIRTGRQSLKTVRADLCNCRREQLVRHTLSTKGGVNKGVIDVGNTTGSWECDLCQGGAGGGSGKNAVCFVLKYHGDHLKISISTLQEKHKGKLPKRETTTFSPKLLS